MSDHIFISYCREDQPYVHDLERDLLRRGFDVWSDARIKTGKAWWRAIAQAIRTSAAFIVVMTPASEDSDWVEKEIMVALRERKPVFPLLLRGEEFTLLISTQYVDVRDGKMPRDSFYIELEQVVFSPLPVSVPTEPEMILIPAGEFRMGSKRRHRFAQDNEQPQHTLYLPNYYLAKTLVTNAQYAAFVQDTGNRRPTHWGSGRGRPPMGKETHPVVYVSWQEAAQYCDWLSQVTGKRYRLPSEAEWEKAARGTDGRAYPWGKRWYGGRCNNADEYSDDTTPVGSYPKGASSHGLLDMAGNVWEWTLSLWGEDTLEPDFAYPYRPWDERENPDAGNEVRRVLRGGSFADVAGDVRCAVRHAHLPYRRFRIVGFRVAASRL